MIRNRKLWEVLCQKVLKCSLPSLEIQIVLKILRKGDWCQTTGSCQTLFAMKWQSLFSVQVSSQLTLSCEWLSTTAIPSPWCCRSPSFPMTQLLRTLGQAGHRPDGQCLCAVPWDWRGAVPWCCKCTKAWHCSRESKVWVPLRGSEIWQTRTSRSKLLGKGRVDSLHCPINH